MSDSGHLRELFLVRHAKSDWKEELPDQDRPISEKGKKAALRLGEWLKHKQLAPDFVMVSPAKRTQQTLKRLNLDKDHTDIVINDRLYHAELEDLIAILKDIPKKYESVMLIGHNPGFESLKQYLETKPDCEGCEAGLFPTGTLAHFILPANWKHLTQGSGKLTQFIRPKDTKLKSGPRT